MNMKTEHSDVQYHLQKEQIEGHEVEDLWSIHQLFPEIFNSSKIQNKTQSDGEGSVFVNRTKGQTA